MDDIRGQMNAVVDAMSAEGIEPVFLVVDLWGAENVKHHHGAESLQKLLDAAIDSIVNACGGAALAYGEFRIVGILPGASRLKTFALIQKLQRALPLLGQSFDCLLQPDFDLLDYDPRDGIAGVMSQLVKMPMIRIEAA